MKPFSLLFENYTKPDKGAEKSAMSSGFKVNSFSEDFKEKLLQATITS